MANETSPARPRHPRNPRRRHATCRWPRRRGPHHGNRYLGHPRPARACTDRNAALVARSNHAQAGRSAVPATKILAVRRAGQRGYRARRLQEACTGRGLAAAAARARSPFRRVAVEDGGRYREGAARHQGGGAEQRGLTPPQAGARGGEPSLGLRDARFRAWRSIRCPTAMMVAATAATRSAVRVAMDGSAPCASSGGAGAATRR